MRNYVILAALACGITLGQTAFAAVLGDDRADVMYHRYQGGGVTVDGPAILVRKKYEEKYAVTAEYYMDMVSSASIDVVTTASPYTEQRKEADLGFEYLRDKVTYSIGYSNSTESDYQSNTAHVTVSQDMFGDLTTLSMSFARGWDKVSRRGDSQFHDHVDRRVYSLDLTQIATPRLVLGASWETTTEEGFLNNPYRSVRYLDPGSASGYAYQPERYPRTRTGNAAALRGRYFLPFHAAVQLEYRYYFDDWKLHAHTAELSYTQPLGNRWLLDAHYRYYRQGRADFYSDLFPREDYQNFLARDKELAAMHSNTLGVAASYQFAMPWLRSLQKTTINLKYDLIMFSYDNFRDLRRTGRAPGTEPLYSFDASVVQLFLSGWF